MTLPGRVAGAVAINPAMRRMATQIDALFETMLAPPPDPRNRLYEAMRYAAVGGGKRLRPLLVHASGRLFGVAHACSLRAGLAVECIHAHSLVHDDLPCMDDDDLRRGKPTVHRAFDEATAVLAGDALLALAFEVLGDPATHPSAEVRAELIVELARASGAGGMAGGQMLDLLPQSEGFDLDAVTRLQRLKTGALIGWCLEAGAIMGGASPELRTSVRGYAHCLGLAFQIADDLLDFGGAEESVGKRVGKDAGRGKGTFVSLLGPKRARRQAHLLVAQAIEHLRPFGEAGDLLAGIVRFAVERDH
jgi:farnesyl diphosphate synthase